MSVSAVLVGPPVAPANPPGGFYCGRIFIRRGGFHPAECPAGGPLIGHREPSAGGVISAFSQVMAVSARHHGPQGATCVCLQTPDE